MAILLIDRNAARQVHVFIGLLFLQSDVSLKSEVPLLALRESPALFFFGQVDLPNVRVPRGRCHRTVHDATVVQKFSFALLRRRSLCSVCFPKNSTDVGRNKQFPTPCTCTGTRSAGASVGCMMPSYVVTDTSTTLRVRFQDRWSTSHYRTRAGQRIVIVCCPSFPWHKGARRETVAIDPRRGFPEDELFVCSFSAATWQRGPHFSGWPRPAISLRFSIRSSVFLLFVLLLFFLKTPKKKTHLHNAQLRFPGKLRLCT